MRFFSIIMMLGLGLFGLFTLSVSASVLDPLGSTKTTTTEQTSPEPIDLLKLSADWWKPLQNTHPHYAGFMAELSDKLHHLIEQQIPEQQLDWDDKFSYIQIQLTTLSGLQGKQSSNINTLSAQIKDQYGWKDFVETLQTLKKQQIALDQANAELKQLTQVESLISAQTDTAMAKYLEQAHLISLFRVIDTRLQWLIHQERVRLHKTQVTEAQQKLEAAQQSFKAAQQRLNLTPDDMQELIKLRDKLPQQLDQIGDLIRNKQAILAVMVADDEQTKANALAETLALIEAQLQEAKLKSEQLWLSIAEIYMTTRLHQDSSWLGEKREAFAQWQKDNQQLREQIRLWRNDLEKYREKAQVSLLLSEKDSAPKQTQKISKLYSKSMNTANSLIDNSKSIIHQLDDSNTLLSLLRHQLQTQDGLLKSGWLDMENSLLQAWQTTQDLLNISLFKIGETPVTTAGILRVIIIITLIWWFSYWLRKGLTRFAQGNERIRDSTIYNINRILHYVIMVIGVMVALSSVGLDFSNVAWIAGALSVGIGFGLQSIVNNFVSGLIIMFERSLKVGDFIELQSGVVGSVSQINMRSTIIRTGDNLEIVVPNSEFISGRVVNWTLTDNYRRMRIPFNVDYGCDKEQVVAAVMAAAQRVPFTVTEEGREPQVWMTNLGANGLDFELLVWVQHGANIEHELAGSRQSPKSAYIWEIEAALTQSGIGIPFPQQDLHLKSFLDAANIKELMHKMKDPSQPSP